MDYILGEGIAQRECGAHILDVNVGLPGIDEKDTMVSVISALQAVVPTPLQIDSSDPETIESALRINNGKPMVNSVNGKAESMEAVFRL
jgi:5-methyltetrahydrofolate--homocysteine methyltransferase